MTELEQILKKMGIQSGDILYVASDMMRLLYDAYEKYGIETTAEQDSLLDGLVNVLQKTVGENGTLLFPVFTWDFYRGHNYDVRKTMGETGALGNYVLKCRKDFRRTLHVSHSFMVWGKDAEMLVNMDNTHAWLGNSPFDYFYEKSAKMLMLHVPAVRCCTFQHYAEEKVNAPLRYIKEFKGLYTDAQGVTSERIYPHFVRDLRLKCSQCMQDEFLKEHADAEIERWENGTLLLVDLQKAVNAVEYDLRYNEGKNCYKFTNYKMNWNLGDTHLPELMKLDNSKISVVDTRKCGYMKYDDISLYKKALLSYDINPKEIIRDISIPESVFKYRSFKNRHLTDSLEGKFFFSLPSNINVNDPDDCVVWIDSQRCIQHIQQLWKCDLSVAAQIHSYLRKNWIEPGVDDSGNKRTGLQDKVKIACFTSVSPKSSESDIVWNSFAIDGGYCIEYKVRKELFYPQNIIFLPVCYDTNSETACNDRYDDTDYVLRLIDCIYEQLNNGVKVPQLDQSFVAQGYNHTLFKPVRYSKEREWRIVVPCNRDGEYFDEMFLTGGKKYLASCMEKIYIGNGKEEDIDIVIDYAQKHDIKYEIVK